MNSETLLHINEDLSDSQRSDLLASLGNRTGYREAHLHSNNPHFMFVAFDPEELCPHDLVDIAAENGLHAQVVDL